MKTYITLFAALVGLFSVAHADTILLSDNFSGPTLDTSKWQTIFPFGSSTVVQGGGAVTTTGRGILGTTNEYFQPYVINGAFSMLSDLEHFIVGFRTDLSPLPDADLYHTLSGLFVEFSNDGNQISIQGRGYSGLVKSYALNTGDTYFFSIFDDGTNISLAINGITELTDSTTLSTGNHVAFYSREFPFTGTALDAVTITSVPDAGSTALYLGLGVVIIAFGARQSKSRLQSVRPTD